MMRNLLNWLKGGKPGHGARTLKEVAQRVLAGLRIPWPEAPQLIQRIQIMERDMILPLKAAAIGMLIYSFYFTPWIGKVLNELDIAVESTQYFFGIYMAINVAVALMLLFMKWFPLPLIQWTVFVNCLVDGIFLSALTVVTGGIESVLYFLFLGMIARGAVSVPRATSQIMLNLTLAACYLLSGIIDITIGETFAQDRDEAGSMLIGVPGSPVEVLALRVALLVLMTLCCYAVQVLLQRQKVVFEQESEFALRENQLRSAGRLAAEFAHQIKNPLAIINTAAFSLQRGLKDGKTDAAGHLKIIQEEVERADRIITQIMGYAQLSEGRVERLDVKEELEKAIREAFPPGSLFPVQVHRAYDAEFPPLLMQQRHASDIFTNLLLNARDALDGCGGDIFVSAHCRGDDSIEVTIRDEGPGIPADKLERIFEAYYTTKDKGTGLGLATVKHNIELYGGTVSVESELGKGARFTLLFPARTLINLSKQS
jgi:signal transduction histidine kinase